MLNRLPKLLISIDGSQSPAKACPDRTTKIGLLKAKKAGISKH